MGPSPSTAPKSFVCWAERPLRLWETTRIFFSTLRIKAAPLTTLLWLPLMANAANLRPVIAKYATCRPTILFIKTKNRPFCRSLASRWATPWWSNGPPPVKILNTKVNASAAFRLAWWAIPPWKKWFSWEHLQANHSRRAPREFRLSQNASLWMEPIGSHGSPANSNPSRWRMRNLQTSGSWNPKSAFPPSRIGPLLAPGKTASGPTCGL